MLLQHSRNSEDCYKVVFTLSDKFNNNDNANIKTLVLFEVYIEGKKIVIDIVTFSKRVLTLF